MRGGHRKYVYSAKSKSADRTLRSGQAVRSLLVHSDHYRCGAPGDAQLPGLVSRGGNRSICYRNVVRNTYRMYDINVIHSVYHKYCYDDDDDIEFICTKIGSCYTLCIYICKHTYTNTHIYIHIHIHTYIFIIYK